MYLFIYYYIYYYYWVAFTAYIVTFRVGYRNSSRVNIVTKARNPRTYVLLSKTSSLCLTVSFLVMQARGYVFIIVHTYMYICAIVMTILPQVSGNMTHCREASPTVINLLTSIGAVVTSQCVTQIGFQHYSSNIKNKLALSRLFRWFVSRKPNKVFFIIWETFEN